MLSFTRNTQVPSSLVFPCPSSSKFDSGGRHTSSSAGNLRTTPAPSFVRTTRARNTQWRAAAG
eukprot:3601131-Rhodomonas_salina.1